jgi:hypothetical protein
MIALGWSCPAGFCTLRGDMRGFLMLSAGLVASGVLGCEPEPPKVPNPTRTLDERRAIEIIRTAVQAEGMAPAPGRDETLPVSGKPIHIDVGIDGKKFGIVYVSDDDQVSLGKDVGEPNKKGEKLNTGYAGADNKVHFVLLYQTNYRYDDLVGQGHEQTTITAEGELARDVRDFVTYARSHKEAFP